MMKRLCALALAPSSYRAWFQQQTWESAMAVGQQALQQGNYANAERIFLGGRPLTAGAGL